MLKLIVFNPKKHRVHSKTQLTRRQLRLLETIGSLRSNTLQPIRLKLANVRGTSYLFVVLLTVVLTV